MRATRPVRNRVGWRERLRRLQGSPVQLDVRAYDASLDRIAGLEEGLEGITHAALENLARDLRRQARSPEPSEDLRAHVFALAREVSRRMLGMRPFDVQVVAALALDEGAVVDMQTGEGKTLTAVMPAAWNALRGQNVHVLTFNDYLARRDAEWMGPVYRMLGLTTGYVQHGMPARDRRAAYGADVTYVTAKEAGFDHLRDMLAMDTADLVHRRLDFALVDEADSLMIDEARVPLVIAGTVDDHNVSAPRFAGLVGSMAPGVHYTVDEYARNVELTDAGIAHVERILACGPLHSQSNYVLLTGINCALHARVLLRSGVDYIVRDGRAQVVDEFTGRVVSDRQWPDGLQAAIEAKEGIPGSVQGRILDSLTLQRFLLGYPRLCGMSGTAREAASELQEIYGLRVVVIPTHRPVRRLDRPDQVFTHRDAKEAAVVDEVRRVSGTGRPVLVGTLTVEESEQLADRFKAAGIQCHVLNARNDEAEAAIVRRAGGAGVVTIATNMAGRGTDIRLGGDDESDRDRIAALGGLYVIGTNRHESRRVDLQLRGRAGRQGDPGESRLFVSLDDDLLVRYGVRDLLAGRWMPEHGDAPVDSPLVRREIARTQRIVEGQNLEIRRTLARYAGIVEQQHRIVKARRHALLTGEVRPDVWQRAPGRRAALVAGAGEEAVVHAERAVTLFQIDSAWRDHLAFCSDLREGIHLVRLGGQDPLARFTQEVVQAFADVEERIDGAVLAAMESVRITDGALDLSGLQMKAPASTWTYLVNDDPFRNQIGSLLTGVGGKTVAIYAAAVLMPLLILWGMVDNLVRRRRSYRP